jgi:hypothetical protein
MVKKPLSGRPRLVASSRHPWAPGALGKVPTVAAGRSGGSRVSCACRWRSVDAQCMHYLREHRSRAAIGGSRLEQRRAVHDCLVHSQDLPKFMKFRLREFPQMFINGAYPANTLLIIRPAGDGSGAGRSANRRGFVGPGRNGGHGGVDLPVETHRFMHTHP